MQGNPKLKDMLISIHALLAESDQAADMSTSREARISIHALLAESDYILVNTFLAIFEFLSTLSLRRATVASLLAVGGSRISIHALLAESDLMMD